MSWYDFVAAYLLGVVSSLTATYLSLWGQRGYRKYILYPKINLLRRSDGSQPVFVVPAIPEAGRRFTTPLESVIVVNEFVRIYQGMFFTQNLPQVCNEGNIICIGGPVHNVFARKLIEYLRTSDGTRVPYYFKDHTLMSEKTGKEYNSRSADDKIVSDVCLVIITRNPYGSSRKSVLLLAGCRGYGAIGLAKYLGSGDLILDLTKQFHYKSGTSVSFIVSFRVEHNENGPMDARYSDYAIEEFHGIE